MTLELLLLSLSGEDAAAVAAQLADVLALPPDQVADAVQAQRADLAQRVADRGERWRVWARDHATRLDLLRLVRGAPSYVPGYDREDIGPRSPWWHCEAGALPGERHRVIAVFRAPDLLSAAAEVDRRFPMPAWWGEVDALDQLLRLGKAPEEPAGDGCTLTSAGWVDYASESDADLS